MHDLADITNWRKEERERIERNLSEQVTQDRWQKVNRVLLAKILREFSYEGLLEPRESESHPGEFSISFPSANATYFYQAQKRVLGDFEVDPLSIRRFISDQWKETEHPEACQFFLECYQQLGVKSFTATYFIKELQNTLLSDMLLLQLSERNPAFTLLEKSYEELEGHLSGHPWLVVSKGRFGLSFEDTLNYTPESKQRQRLHWLAIHREKVQVYTHDVNMSEMIIDEMGEQLEYKFRQKLISLHLNPEDYQFFPVLQWQWEKMLINHYIGQIAKKEIISLGAGEEEYLPQQAIRTLSPMSNPLKHYVKLTMTIFNTAVYRGMPYPRVAIASEMTTWLKKVQSQDPFLSEERSLLLLGEVAGLTVEHSLFHQIEKPPYQFIEMMAVLWRESLGQKLQSGERAIGLGALLHLDAQGNSLLATIIGASHLSPKEWFNQFHQVVLFPLLHYLYQYGVAFNAHGQNLILILKDHTPCRLGVKDFSDDVNISECDYPELRDFPAKCQSVVLRQPPEVLIHFIFSSLFICHYRYMAGIVAKDFLELYSEREFWQGAGEVIRKYQQMFPHLAERFQEMDLLAPKMIRVCLNRVRALTYGYSDDSGRPEPAIFGDLDNPLV